MARFSPAVGVAHRIAAVEARATQHAKIEMDHLLAGIGRALQPGGGAELKSELLDWYRREATDLRSLLIRHGVEHLRLTRVVRLGPDSGPPASESRKVHRSPRARRVFERAQELVAVPTGTATLSHLLAAFLDEAEDLFRDALGDQEVDLLALREALTPVSPPGELS